MWCDARVVKETPSPLASRETKGSLTPVAAQLWSPPPPPRPRVLWQSWCQHYLQLLNRKPGSCQSCDLRVWWWEGLSRQWLCAFHWRPGLLLSSSRRFISHIKNTQNKDRKEMDQNVINFCLPFVHWSTKWPNLAAFCSDCLSAAVLQIISHKTYSVKVRWRYIFKYLHINVWMFLVFIWNVLKGAWLLHASGILKYTWSVLTETPVSCKENPGAAA